MLWEGRIPFLQAKDGENWHWFSKLDGCFPFASSSSLRNFNTRSHFKCVHLWDFTGKRSSLPVEPVSLHLFLQNESIRHFLWGKETPGERNKSHREMKETNTSETCLSFLCQQSLQPSLSHSWFLISVIYFSCWEKTYWRGETETREIKSHTKGMDALRATNLQDAAGRSILILPQTLVARKSQKIPNHTNMKSSMTTSLQISFFWKNPTTKDVAKWNAWALRTASDNN